MPQDPQLAPALLENVEIIFRNFEGREQKFNPPGSKNFAVLLDEKTAREMTADGWNVKQKDPREDDEEGEPYWFLPVALGYNNKAKAPNVNMVTSRGRTHLTEETVEVLDSVDIVNVDLIVNPSFWEQPGGKSGIKAYVKSLFVTINEDPLERKYAEMEAQSS